MSQAPEADDFVDLVGQMAGFIQNQRIAAYNEAVDDMLAKIREWMRNQGMAGGLPNDLSELLDLIEGWFTEVGGPHKPLVSSGMSENGVG